MHFAPIELRFLRDVLIEQCHRKANDVAVIEHRLASALIEAGYACPIGAEPVPQLRPIVGQFMPRARR